jgi:hypothetical protein
MRVRANLSGFFGMQRETTPNYPQKMMVIRGGLFVMMKYRDRREKYWLTRNTEKNTADR